MNFEEDIFKKAKVIFNNLEEYGFRKENNQYVCFQKILYDTLRDEQIMDLINKSYTYSLK